jgi:hypothetical protein
MRSNRSFVNDILSAYRLAVGWGNGINRKALGYFVFWMLLALVLSLIASMALIRVVSAAPNPEPPPAYVTIRTYLDNNNNGVMDINEGMAPGIWFKMTEAHNDGTVLEFRHHTNNNGQHTQTMAPCICGYTVWIEGYIYNGEVDAGDEPVLILVGVQRYVIHLPLVGG